MKLITGNSLEELKQLEDNSIDSIVTDPPYGLSFMGKKWDYDVPSTDLWREAIRVLKPGGHLLSFAGSRTYHRMAVNIEDAGFEIRDQIMWVYGSGFPKSHNIGKAVDKKLGNERDVVGKNREGRTTDGGYGKNYGANTDITKGNSPWEGWGTALKPAHEPIVMARKPFKGTVVDNVLEHGTGGINIDECRVETTENLNGGAYSDSKDGMSQNEVYGKYYKKPGEYEQPQGRFPANFIHDGSDEVVSEFPESKSTGGKNTNTNDDGQIYSKGLGGGIGANAGGLGDKGSAARFFYCAKASKAERNKGLGGFEEKNSPNNLCSGSVQKSGEGTRLDGKPLSKNKNHHPTVKPVKLMEYLVRLVTPKGGTVLDPFMGSGTTGIACKEEGFDFVGIEREEEYIEIAKARINDSNTTS